ncbi:MAG: hypothetical protein WD334_03370 [Chitinophagales bacterium]
MEKGQLIELLKYPVQTDVLENIQLETALEQYPYCNSLHLLAAKKARLLNKQNQADLLFNASLHSCDRKQLYYFMEAGELKKKDFSDLQKKREISPGLIARFKKDTSRAKPREKVSADKKDIPSERKALLSEEPPASKAAVKKQKVKKANKEASEHSFTGWLSFVQNKKTTNTPPSKTIAEQENSAQEEQVQEMDDQIKAHAYEAELIKTAAELKDVADKKSEAEDKKNEVLEKDVDEMARKSSDEQQSNITETLAMIFENQNKYTKAIEAYEFLSLKYPEKSSFFAGKIENLKNKL